VSEFADFNIDGGSAALKKAGTNQPNENRLPASSVWRGLLIKVEKTNSTYAIGAKNEAITIIYICGIACSRCPGTGDNPVWIGQCADEMQRFD
jgi:hypothetical protein